MPVLENFYLTDLRTFRKGELGNDRNRESLLVVLGLAEDAAPEEYTLEAEGTLRCCQSWMRSRNGIHGDLAMCLMLSSELCSVIGAA